MASIQIYYTYYSISDQTFSITFNIGIFGPNFPYTGEYNIGFDWTSAVDGVQIGGSHEPFEQDLVSAFWNTAMVAGHQTISISFSSEWESVVWKADLQNFSLSTSGVTVSGWSEDADTLDLVIGSAFGDVLNLGSGDDCVDGGDGDDTIFGEAGDDYLVGGNGDDVLDGGIGDDTLEGGSGDDTLTDGDGFDVLVGGSGNDVYLVGAEEYTIIEWEDEGVDTILSYYTTFLPDDVEVLILEGNSDIAAFGNFQDNTLIGNDGSNTLYGDWGADTMIGHAGDDYYEVDDAGDVVVEVGDFSGGIDVVGSEISYTLPTGVETLILHEYAGAANGTGNDSDNTLIGTSETNYLDGKAGADWMFGEYGNDYYVIDDANDIAIELEGEGTDTARSYVSHTLSANVERLTLWGTSAINATGNSLGNTLTGNAATNYLDGKGGADKMVGLGGDDFYIVDNKSDVVAEASGGGTDTVRSYVSYVLDTNVEKLNLWGSSAINGTGNSLSNTIVGNGANNILNGAAGTDTLTGGGGKDTFFFNTALGSSNVDKITDFSVPNDTIRLENAIFKALTKTGGLASSAFKANASGTAADGNDRIVYETDTGKLFYDSNGNASGGSIHFATLTAGLSLTHADFMVV